MRCAVEEQVSSVSSSAEIRVAALPAFTATPAYAEAAPGTRPGLILFVQRLLPNPIREGGGDQGGVKFNVTFHSNNRRRGL